MKRLQSQYPTGKNYRPSLRCYSFAAFSAQAIAEREDREDEISGSAMRPASGEPHQGQAHRRPAPGVPPVSCCAPTAAGNICGVTPAPFLDFVRGGFVCSAHKPERGEG